LTAAWTAAYALYRSYYALGGTWGILGTPASHEQWIRINAIASAMLLVTAALAIATVPGWRNPRAVPWLLVFCWLVTVTCVGHAAIAMPSRVLSLMGVVTIEYPFWEAIDARKADLQDLFFNEPWFLIEGLLWGSLAWFGALRDSSRRGWWLVSAAVACTIATVFGLLTTLGVIDRVIVG
jgi:hypothetical protein